MVFLLKIINNTNFKKFLILLILLGFYIFISANSYVSAVSKNLEDSLFRLHVVANSDSDEDQNLKYIVRDALISHMNILCKNCTTKEDAINIVQDNLENFYNIAKETIENNGFDYDVDIEIGNFNFPTKKYGDISLPAGYYDSLRVKIGKAEGQNWWCVMFPPLCFVDVSTGIVPNESKELMKDNLSEEEFALVSDTPDNSIKFKFKLLEFFANNGLITAKK